MKDANGKVIRKTLPKKEVLKLKPGTLIRVCWIDSADTIHVVLEKPIFCVGDMPIRAWTKGGTYDFEDCLKIAHDQVVEVLGEIEFEVDDARNVMRVYTKNGEQVIPLN